VIHERGNEDKVAEKTVELGDHQPGLVFPAGGKAARELRPVVSLALLGFRKLGNYAPVASVQIIPDGFLHLQPKTRFPLSIRRDVAIGTIRAGLKWGRQIPIRVLHK